MKIKVFIFCLIIGFFSCFKGASYNQFDKKNKLKTRLCKLDFPNGYDMIANINGYYAFSNGMTEFFYCELEKSNTISKCDIDLMPFRGVNYYIGCPSSIVEVIKIYERNDFVIKERIMTDPCGKKSYSYTLNHIQIKYRIQIYGIDLLLKEKEDLKFIADNIKVRRVK